MAGNARPRLTICRSSDRFLTSTVCMWRPGRGMLVVALGPLAGELVTAESIAGHRFARSTPSAPPTRYHTGRTRYADAVTLGG